MTYLPIVFFLRLFLVGIGNEILFMRMAAVIDMSRDQIVDRICNSYLPKANEEIE